MDFVQLSQIARDHPHLDTDPISICADAPQFDLQPVMIPSGLVAEQRRLLSGI
jgi:hypothetical protein